MKGSHCPCFSFRMLSSFQHVLDQLHKLATRKQRRNQWWSNVFIITAKLLLLSHFIPCFILSLPTFPTHFYMNSWMPGIEVYALEALEVLPLRNESVCFKSTACARSGRNAEWCHWNGGQRERLGCLILLTLKTEGSFILTINFNCIVNAVYKMAEWGKKINK